MNNLANQQPPIPTHEHLRLQKLYSYSIVQTPPENPFDNIAQLAAQLFDAPMAQLSFVDSDHVFVKSNIGALHANDIPREESLAALAISTNEPTLFNQARTTAAHRFLTANNIAFYLAVPLLSPEGLAIGALSVFDTRPQEIASQKLGMLKSLAALVIDFLEMRLSSRLVAYVQTDLTNKLAHDLKNPNTTISLATEIIKKKIDDADIVNNFADRIKSATGNILANIDQAMEVSQIENGNFRLSMQEVNIQDLLKLVISDFDLRLQQKHLKVYLNSSTSTLVTGDAKRLRDAFAQLLSNAITYSYPHAKIYIELSKADENLMIVFKDEGQGLSEADMRKLFIKFAKLSAIPTHKEYSHGVGLSIARTLIELHKGKIWATSEGKDTGASFYVTLPLN
ncbi:GAF domain-containing sensor histidine kinase [Pedobacter sp. KR3-3]|uniref:histidine kinase n=1 Tax=Pedobacter albus TaxID=3113905 RepID=A0ABU7I395_9SPHI|nr:GAF domain-containing sensor histidine kinase [Pedobacter sp. KR3-3]MEE1943836.1 GAF domain-containing sensor histidine kinase [Pedobacter sp. KR3-3]